MIKALVFQLSALMTARYIMTQAGDSLSIISIPYTLYVTKTELVLSDFCFSRAAYAAWGGIKIKKPRFPIKTLALYFCTFSFLVHITVNMTAFLLCRFTYALIWIWIPPSCREFRSWFLLSLHARA